MEPLRASDRTPRASAWPSPEGRIAQDRSLAIPVLSEARRLRHRSKRFPGCVVRRRVPCGTPICRAQWSRPPDRDARASAVCATGEDSIGLWGSVCLIGGIAGSDQPGEPLRGIGDPQSCVPPDFAVVAGPDSCLPALNNSIPTPRRTTVKPVPLQNTSLETKR